MHLKLEYQYSCQLTEHTKGKSLMDYKSGRVGYFVPSIIQNIDDYNHEPTQFHTLHYYYLCKYTLKQAKYCIQKKRDYYGHHALMRERRIQADNSPQDSNGEAYILQVNWYHPEAY